MLGNFSRNTSTHSNLQWSYLMEAKSASLPHYQLSENIIVSFCTFFWLKLYKGTSLCVKTFLVDEATMTRKVRGWNKTPTDTTICNYIIYIYCNFQWDLRYRPTNHSGSLLSTILIHMFILRCTMVGSIKN